jgi:hypothetical protein
MSKKALITSIVKKKLVARGKEKAILRADYVEIVYPPLRHLCLFFLSNRFGTWFCLGFTGVNIFFVIL